MKASSVDVSIRDEIWSRRIKSCNIVRYQLLLFLINSNQAIIFEIKNWFMYVKYV